MKKIALLSAIVISSSASSGPLKYFNQGDAIPVLESVTFEDYGSAPVNALAISSPLGMSKMGVTTSLPLGGVGSGASKSVGINGDDGSGAKDYLLGADGGTVNTRVEGALDNSFDWKSSVDNTFDAVFRPGGSGRTDVTGFKVRGAFLRLSYGGSLDGRDVTGQFSTGVTASTFHSSGGTNKMFAIDLQKGSDATKQVTLDFHLACRAFKTGASNPSHTECKDSNWNAGANKFVFDTDTSDYRNFVIGLVPARLIKKTGTIGAGAYTADLKITFAVA